MFGQLDDKRDAGNPILNIKRRPAPAYFSASNILTSFSLLWQIKVTVSKLDGVGPIDKRPSTDWLHHFVRKKEEEKNDT